MNIGFGENDIGTFYENSTLGQDTLNVFYKGGFYYISDTKNNKIIKTTEKGIHVLVIFNPESNPHLRQSTTQTDESSDNTNDIAYVKQYKEFSIITPGKITADIDKNIYVVNNDPQYKKNDNNGFLSNSLILKFDNNGSLKYVIGKNGIDSSPFSYISKMITDQKNNLIVYEKNENENNIYKFGTDGTLKSKTSISQNDVPKTSEESNLIVDIINIIPGFIEDEIYLTCQYIKEKEDNFSIKNYEIIYEKILKYSLKTNKISKLIISLKPKKINFSKLKLNPELKELYGDKKEIVEPMENLMGADVSGRMFFYKMELPLELLNENKQSLSIYDNNGKLLKEILLEQPLNVQYVSEFYLSSEGKVFYYYIIDGEVQFVSII